MGIHWSWLHCGAATLFVVDFVCGMNCIRPTSLLGPHVTGFTPLGHIFTPSSLFASECRLFSRASIFMQLQFGKCYVFFNLYDMQLDI
jgi:hypothetical protein